MLIIARNRVEKRPDIKIFRALLGVSVGRFLRQEAREHAVPVRYALVRSNVSGNLIEARAEPIEGETQFSVQRPHAGC